MQNQIVFPGLTGLPLARPQAPHAAGRAPRGNHTACPCVPPAWATIPSPLCLVRGDCGLSQGMMPGHAAAPPSLPRLSGHHGTQRDQSRGSSGGRWVGVQPCLCPQLGEPRLSKSAASSSLHPLGFCSIPACPPSCSALLASLSFQSSHVTAFLPHLTHSSSRMGLQHTLLLTRCSVPAWGYFIPSGPVPGEGSWQTPGQYAWLLVIRHRIRPSPQSFGQGKACASNLASAQPCLCPYSCLEAPSCCRELGPCVTG